MPSQYRVPYGGPPQGAMWNAVKSRISHIKQYEYCWIVGSIEEYLNATSIYLKSCVFSSLQRLWVGLNLVINYSFIKLWSSQYHVPINIMVVRKDEEEILFVTHMSKDNYERQ